MTGMANVRASLVLGLFTALVSQGCAPTMTTNYAKNRLQNLPVTGFLGHWMASELHRNCNNVLMIAAIIRIPNLSKTD